MIKEGHLVEIYNGLRIRVNKDYIGTFIKEIVNSVLDLSEFDYEIIIEDINEDIVLVGFYDKY